MNLLQYICNEEAVNILKFVTLWLDADPELKQTMAQHRDSHLGSQAIHLASATGNHTMIQLLITQYGADVRQLNQNNQTVYHCASQRYEGIAAIFVFGYQYKLEVTATDARGATALHFAAISLLIKNV